VEDLRGGDAKANAALTLEILKGARGPRLDIVLLNAACGIYVGGGTLTLQEALDVAAEKVISGAAYDKLMEYIERSRPGACP
jgi:anthranilate phosphoribosyltransferase